MEGVKGVSLTTLRSLPMFARVPDEQLAKIAAVACLRRVARHTNIVHAGDHTDSLYVLLNGSANVVNCDEEGREVILYVLRPGEFFGEMGLLDDNPRSASVISLESCDLIAIAKQDFKRILMENFEVSLYLMRGLVQRLREADRKIESLALLDVYGRVAKLLLDMSEDINGQKVITRKITKQDIAKMIGASREMVSRVMKDLESRGYIRSESRRIVITQG